MNDYCREQSHCSQSLWGLVAVRMEGQSAGGSGEKEAEANC